MRKTKNILINITISIFVTFICLLFFETTLRVLGVGCSIVDKNGNGPYVISHNHYHLKSNYSGRLKCLEFDTTIQTNSYGYRDSEFNTTNNIILLLGDSMVFGYGVEQNETFADILEKRLHSNGFSVYNIGTLGYSPKGYITQLNEYLPEFNPKIVIVSLYEGNDAQENCGMLNRAEFLGETRKGFGKIKDFLKRLYIIRFTEPLIKNIIDLGDSALTSKQFYLVDEPENVKECNKLLKESMKILRDLTYAYNKEIIFLILPSKMNFIQSDDPGLDYNKKIDTMMGFCSELNLKCFNIKNSISDPSGIYLKEGHLNKEGHNKIAKLINDFLLKEGILENG